MNITMNITGTTTNRWVDIGALEDIPAQGARLVKTALGCVAVFRTARDEVFAIDDRCPHSGGPLSEGIVHGDHVTCPLHNWTIGLCNGQAAAPDEGSTPAFSVKVDNGQVFLSEQELASVGTDLTRPVAGPARRTGAGTASTCGGHCA